MINTKLIERCKRNDQQAYEMLYNQTLPYIITLCRRYGIENKNTEDVVQDIYSELFSSIKNYKETKGIFLPWFRRVGVCVILKSFRNKDTKYLELNENANELKTSPEDLIAYKEIMILINKLPEGYRNIFKMAVLDGLKHVEISKLLGISTSTSRSQLSRAKEILKKQLINLNSTNYGTI